VEPEDQIDRSLGARRRALPGIGWLLLNLGLFTLTLMAWVVLPGALAWIVGYAADEDLADLLGAWFYFTAIVLPATGSSRSSTCWCSRCSRGAARGGASARWRWR